MTAHELYLTLRAIVLVLHDSNRTEQIHLVEETTGRRRLARALRELFDGEEGRALLRDRPELCRAQVDFDALRALPEGTLGRAYVDHLDRNGITADLQARPTRHVEDPDVSYLVRRFRQTHDIWHPLLDLGIAPHEEVIIHAFSFGQLQLPVSALVVFFGSIKHLVLEQRWGALRRALGQAYRSGRDAAPLLPVYWERMWREPIAEVRRRHGVRPCVRAFVEA
jgi:ubiquinone biosynthesis protein COQ4